MSPVSRGRKRQKTRNRTKGFASPLFSVPDICECPACCDAFELDESGLDENGLAEYDPDEYDPDEYDPRHLIGDLTATVSMLAKEEDPLAAEIAGAAVVSLVALVGESYQEALVRGFIPAFEAQADDDALMLLLAISAVTPPPAGEAAAGAAKRLVALGHTEPAWAAQLHAPVRLTSCRRIGDSAGIMSVLVATFQRGELSHTFITTVDHLNCGAASQVQIIDATDINGVVKVLRANSRTLGLDVVDEALRPADYRARVEQALDARAIHDEERTGGELAADLVDEDVPGYPAMSLLLRARIQTLPQPRQTASSHRGHGTVVEASSAATRTRRQGSAPIYQIKVGLLGAKPPIWRRLEVPADMSLATLHHVIQVAFGWGDCHMHVFETASGNFGVADRQLGYRSEKPVTLEQVAPAVKSTIRYTYDFGDDWEHDIVVEKVLDRSSSVTYPRCTGGRRAAPPDDCGGVWGYANLIEAVRDPAHPDHEDLMDWMGLTDSAQFDPEHFDAASITSALARLR
jgi:Plasmid pRiA4b ORF-3-like protein